MTTSAVRILLSALLLLSAACLGPETVERPPLASEQAPLRAARSVAGALVSLEETVAVLERAAVAPRLPSELDAELARLRVELEAFGLEAVTTARQLGRPAAREPWRERTGAGEAELGALRADYALAAEACAPLVRSLDDLGVAVATEDPTATRSLARVALDRAHALEPRVASLAERYRAWGLAPFAGDE